MRILPSLTCYCVAWYVKGIRQHVQIGLLPREGTSFNSEGVHAYTHRCNLQECARMGIYTQLHMRDSDSR